MGDPLDELQGVLGAMRQVSVITTSPAGCAFAIEASVPRDFPASLLHHSLIALATVVEEAVQTGEDLDIESHGGWLSVRITDSG